MNEDVDRVADPDERATNRLELFATVMIAMATVLTAWSAFQSTKWGGVQANSYAGAGAARTESAKASTLAGQLTVIDVTAFEQWVAAYADERRIDPQSSLGPDGEYVPDPAQLSGFLFTRFRDEFTPAVQAWLDLRPLENPKAPPTPFAMKQYVVADSQRADRLATKADSLAATARVREPTRRQLRPGDGRLRHGAVLRRHQLEVREQPAPGDAAHHGWPHDARRDRRPRDVPGRGVATAPIRCRPGARGSSPRPRRCSRRAIADPCCERSDAS